MKKLSLRIPALPICFLLLIFSVSVSLSQPLAGTYTIDSGQPTGGTNFASFNDFASALTANGVSAPVTATVAPGSGPYTEKVVFQSIAGIGASAPVTLEGSGETITALTDSANRHVVRLNSLSYFTINNLHVERDQASTSGFYGIHIYNTGNNITISNCTIDIPGTTSTLAGSIVASGSLTSILVTGDFHNINITGNTTTGGGYGVSLFGLVSNLASDIVITNNTIYDFHSNGVYLRETDGAVVSNNTIDKRTSNVTSANAIQIAQSANINAEIFNNVISVSQTSNGTSILRGIYLFGGTGHRVYNNVIHDIKLTSGDFSAIEVRAASSAPEIYFNTIAIDNTTGTSGTLIGIGEELSNTNSSIKNNIISITQSTTDQKAALVLGATSTVSSLNSNNNILYVPGGNIAMKDALSPSYYATLASWQSASGDDALSLSLDPMFTSPVNSVPTNVAAYDAGVAIPTITTDITGALRGTPPDAGAYEFSPTSISELHQEFQLYPNPANDRLYITTKNQLKSIGYSITDLSGRIILRNKASFENNNAVIDLSKLNEGSYRFVTSAGSLPFLVIR